MLSGCRLALTVLRISATARSTLSRLPLTVIKRSLSLGVSSLSGCTRMVAPADAHQKLSWGRQSTLGWPGWERPWCVTAAQRAPAACCVRVPVAESSPPGLQRRQAHLNRP